MTSFLVSMKEFFARLSEKIKVRSSKKNAPDGAGQDLLGEIKMDEHKISMEELIERLDANESDGLNAHSVLERQSRYGLNVLKPAKQTPEIVKFLKTQTGFFSLLLWAASLLCFIAFGIQFLVDNLVLGVVLATVVLLTGLFSYFQERKSNDLMKSFKQLMADRTLVRREGKTILIDAQYIVVGDIVFLKGGDKVPADLRIISCSDDAKVDNSSLTGESKAVKVNSRFSDDNPLETRNLCFFGTYLTSGELKGIVVNIGDNTVLGRIARLTLQTGSSITPIGREIKRFVTIISIVAISIGVTFFAIGVGLGLDLVAGLVFAIGIIVANVPEGLLATVTVCLSLAASNMARKSVLVKNLEGVETLGSSSCICSDKTGTLTQNVMTVSQLVYDLATWDCRSVLTESNLSNNNPSLIALCRCATLCNRAVFDERSRVDDNGEAVPYIKQVHFGDGSSEMRVMWKTVGDASESALIKFCQNLGDIDQERQRFPINENAVIPFSSANKYQVHVHYNKEMGCWMDLIKGAPERILSRCDSILLNGEVLPLTSEHCKSLNELQLQLSRQGMRVLGFAEKFLPVNEYSYEYEFNSMSINFPIGESLNEYRERAEIAEANGDVIPSRFAMEKFCYIGMMAMIDPPRPQVPAAVELCKRAGIKVIMVTGDHPETAKAIGKKTGIIWSETSDEIKERNEVNGLIEGDLGWKDPDFASAIVVPGWDISPDMPSEVWEDILSHSQCIFARTSPQQKLLIVENCQLRGHIVAVTGDGVNDSPALKKADIGIAMGIMGTDVSKQAADMILLDDNFASIVNGIKNGRLIFDNLKKSIAYTLSSNIPEISPFLALIIVQIPLPLSTILILFIDLGTDIVPAISMAWEGPEADIMGRNPRNSKRDRLVTNKLISFSYLQIGIIQAISGFYTYLTVMSDYGYPSNILPGLAAVDAWGKNTLTCQVRYGAWVNFEGDVCPCFVNPEDNVGFCGSVVDVQWWISESDRSKVISQCQTLGYAYWDQDRQLSYVDDGIGMTDPPATMDACAFPPKHLVGSLTSAPLGFDRFLATTYYRDGLYTSNIGQPTRESLESLRGRNCEGENCPFYYEYLPYRAVMSEFFNKRWNAWPVSDDGVPGLGSSVIESIFFTYEPIGAYSLWDVGEDSLRIVDVGYISNVLQVMSNALNPNSINDGVYTNGFLDVSINLPWISPNLLSNSFFEEFVLNNADDANVVLSSAEVDQAVVILQLSRCGVPLTALDNNSKWYIPGISAFIINQGSYQCDDGIPAETNMVNVVSRESQRNSWIHAQCATFIAIIVVQWADLIVCKTRWLSLYSQGLNNSVMNFALLFETLFGAVLCYFIPINVVGTRPLRITHWFCAMPFSVFIVCYDEVRKYLMRLTSTVDTDSRTGRWTRKPGWLERFTYY